MGLRPLFDDLIQQLADTHGWAVAAVEPWPDHLDLPLDQRLDRVGELDDARIMADAVAAADLLAVEPVAALGFCMGGMVALKAAALDRFDRAVSFYGMVRVPPAWRSPSMADAIETLVGAGRSATATATKVLAVVGTDDPYLPSDHVDELEAAGATVVRYEGAEHGFVHDSSRPAHRPDDAADAWRWAVDWLRVEA
jgi:carboxymethylenebutenolidase